MDNKEEKIFKDLVRAVETAHTNRKKIIWLNFFAGVMRGVGATIGTAFILAIASFILQRFGVFEDVQNWFRSFS